MPLFSSLGDSLGWCLAFFLPAFAMAGPLRRDQGAAQAYLVVVLLHVAFAAVYLYYTELLPSALIRGDTGKFHDEAWSWQLNPEWPLGIGSPFFIGYLAHVYSWVGPSYFLASILTVYAFALSVVVLAKLMELLDIRCGKALVILVFGALPTAISYGTVPMREPYQVLFFMLACYSILVFRLYGHPLYLVSGVGSALLMGLLHKGLIIYAPFLVTIMLFLRIDPRRSRARSPTGRVYLHRFAAILIAAGFVASVSSAGGELEGVRGAEVLRAATTGALVDLAVDGRDEEALNKGRTAYGVALNVTSPMDFVHSTVTLFVYYMLTPFPWHIRSFLDIYAFGEVILRILTLAAIFRMWRRGGPVSRQIVTLLMVVYVSMAFLWATGTTNYGTATRHHMVHQWILLLLGLPALMQATRGFAWRPIPTDVVAQRLSGPRGCRVEPRVPCPRSLTRISKPPPRLGVRVGANEGLQIASSAPRLSSGSRERPRRLAGP